MQKSPEKNSDQTGWFIVHILVGLILPIVSKIDDNQKKNHFSGKCMYDPFLCSVLK